MTRCFVSYARKDDEPFARWLRAELSARGFEIWWDREAMSSRGLSFVQEIFDAIWSADRLLLVAGPAALQSDYVTAEWRHALEVCTVVTPILRLGNEVPEPLRHLHRIDFRARRPRKEALDELVRILAEPVPPLGPTFGVDELPAHYRKRAAALDALKRSLLGDTRRPTAIVSAGTTTSLHGLGGLGKSVLAAAAAHDCEVRRTFCDGVHWLRLGPRSNLDGALRSLLKNLGGSYRGAVGEPGEVLAAIEGRLAGRACLIVLDDVWDLHDVEGLRNAVSGRCRLLLTTRDAGIGHRLGAEQLPLDTLSEREALNLLADWAGLAVDALPPEAVEIARECECLPLALAMVGARVDRRSSRWADMLARLRAADLERIRGDFPNYSYPSVLRAIEVSVDALDPVERELYLSLAAFPEAGVPESVLALSWREMGLDQADVQDVVDALADVSLLRADEAGGLRLHPLQHDFVRRRAGDLARIHQAVLAGYSERFPGGWATAEDDGYLFHHLARHLAAAGRVEELSGLLASRTWLERRIEVSGVGALIEDFRHLPGDPVAETIHGALELSMAAIAREPAQVWSQLEARLQPPLPPAVEALLADPPPPPRLEPIVSPLIPPGGSLLRVFDVGGSKIRAFAPAGDARVGAVGTNDGARVLELETGRVLAVVGEGEEVASVAMSRDGHRVAGTTPSGGIAVWDVATGDRVASLDVHVPEGQEPWVLEDGPAFAGMAFGSSGDRLISAATEGLVVWDLTRQEVVWHRRDLVVTAIRSLKDGRVAVAGYEREGVRALEEALGARREGGSDGDALRANPRGWVMIVDAATGATLVTIPGDRYWRRGHRRRRIVCELAVSADGRFVATSVRLGRKASYRGRFSKIRVWEVESGGIRLQIYTGWARNAIAFSPEGERLVIAGLRGPEARDPVPDGRIELRDTEVGRLLTSIRSRSDDLRSLEMLAGDRIVAVAEDRLSVWDPGLPVRRRRAQSFDGAVDGGAPKARERLDGLPSADLGGGRRILCREDGWCYLRGEGAAVSGDAMAEEARVDWEMPCPGARALAATPDSRELLVAREDGDVWIWDLESRQVVAVLAGPSGPITDLEVSTDGRHAVAASRDRSITVWSLASGHRLARYFGDVGFVGCSFQTEGETITAIDEGGDRHLLRLVVGPVNRAEGRSSPPQSVLDRIRRERDERRRVLRAQIEAEREEERRWQRLKRLEPKILEPWTGDANLRGDDVKVVTSVVILLQGEEAIVLDGPTTEIIDEDLSAEAFSNWKVANVLECPPVEISSERFSSIRVLYQVEKRFPRSLESEKHERAQIETLQAIERALKEPRDED